MPSTLLPKPVERSFLFVPGDQPQRFDKACASAADVVIIDLEDAVAPANKDAARQSIAGWLSAAQAVAIRINAVDTPWFQDDLALCRLPGISGVVLPKAERAEDIDHVAAAIGSAKPIFPLIETAAGIWNAQTVAKCGSVRRLMFGTIDFQFDLGIHGEDEELLYFRSQLVLVSRVAGLQSPVDGVTAALNDPAQLGSDVLRARRLGFGAKLCIHPKQVELVNRGFAPSDDEVRWAQRVVQAMADARGAVVAVDGKMVDRPVLLRAQIVLAGALSSSLTAANRPVIRGVNGESAQETT